MAKEIEKKYIVIDDTYRQIAARSTVIRQGYLSTDPLRTVRVRVKGANAYVTIKGLTQGYMRDEWEYGIPLADAEDMLDRLCDNIISKIRYEVNIGGLTWEVDEFQGKLQGLVVAEVELPDVAYKITSYPAFIGKEVTDDPRYYNSVLSTLDCPPALS